MLNLPSRREITTMSWFQDQDYKYPKNIFWRIFQSLVIFLFYFFCKKGKKYNLSDPSRKGIA